MPSTEIYILGQKYTIKGEASEDHIRELAREIEYKLGDVCSKYPNISSMNALILAAFNMAEDLYSLRLQQDRITSTLKEKAEILDGLLD